ncbi:hypothetical protein BDW42DRAFT_167420 [Aspergillus taichungensis]|uniref:Uncharacterized protein n=1 Tax=Aspergillus taichungensis TaxID=482145 RepID=A0A2J5HX47_9EURO|nr:hypothetical protein BDW42DRAFT_167420 [Aspergillus taichungensis]
MIVSCLRALLRPLQRGRSGLFSLLSNSGSIVRHHTMIQSLGPICNEFDYRLFLRSDCEASVSLSRSGTNVWWGWRGQWMDGFFLLILWSLSLSYGTGQP